MYKTVSSFQGNRMDYYLKCNICNEKYGSNYAGQICGSCSGLLEVQYKKKVEPNLDAESFWDYEDQLPKSKYRHYLLGMTPLVRAHESRSLLMKMEIQNPTHSFKDRGSAVELAKAAEYGFNEVVCASTGNMAYSISYYSKLYGLRSQVFISTDANRDKINDIESVGDAQVHWVKGDFNKALAQAEAYSRKHKAFLTGDYCYRKEGQKTVAYEVMQQVRDLTHFIVPVGNATLISGVYKALREMKAADKIRKMPKIIGVQASGCMPLVRAFKLKKPVSYERPRTKADAIAVGLPTFGNQAMEAFKETNGYAVAVSDRELEAEKERLYENYGIVAELGGVASLAAYRKAGIKENDRAVAIISGANV